MPQPTSSPAASLAGRGGASHLPAHGDLATSVGESERTSGPWPEGPLVGRVARALVLAQQRDGEVRLRLSPPELGTLRIELRVQEGGLVAHLQTETEAARSALLDQLPVLRERLAEQGLRLERFDVDLLPRHGSGQPGHSGGQPRDWPIPPRVAAVSPTPAPEPRAASATASPGRSGGRSGGLDVLV